MGKLQTIDAAFEKYVDVRGSGECWPASEIGGYNKLGWHVTWRCSNRRLLAHRAAWEKFNGHPGKMFVLHKCDNPKCCNPSHLFLGTQADNARDMWAKGRARSVSAKGRVLGPSPRRKLSREQLESAVSAYLKGATQKEIAVALGVTDVALGFALRGKTYPELRDVVAPIQHLLGRGYKRRPPCAS